MVRNTNAEPELPSPGESGNGPAHRNRIDLLQQSIWDWTEDVLDGVLPGLIIFGASGLGKSMVVRDCLKNRGINPDPPVVNKGHMTARGLFDLLQARASAQVVVIDDIEHLFSDPKALGLLRAALGDNPSDKRMVQYQTSTGEEGFQFKAGLIVIGNRIPRQSYADVQAVMEKSHTIEVDVTPEDFSAYLRATLPEQGAEAPGPAGKPMRVSRRDCLVLIRELEKRRVANFRQWSKALRVWVKFRNDAERFRFELDKICRVPSLLMPQVPPNDTAAGVFRQLIEQAGLTEQDRVSEFEKRTRGLRPGRDQGYHRATYFRYKKRWGRGEL